MLSGMTLPPLHILHLRQSWTLSESLPCQFSVYLNRRCPVAHWSWFEFPGPGLPRSNPFPLAYLAWCRQIFTPPTSQHLPHCRGNTRASARILNQRTKLTAIEMCFLLPIHGRLYIWNWVKLYKFTFFHL